MFKRLRYKLFKTEFVKIEFGDTFKIVKVKYLGESKNAPYVILSNLAVPITLKDRTDKWRRWMWVYQNER